MSMQGGTGTLSFKNRVMIFFFSASLLILILRPVIAYLNLWRGDQMIMSRKAGEALNQYRRASILTPRDSAVLSSVGYSLSKAGRHKEAAYYYRKVVELEPQNGQNLYFLGLELLEIEDYPQAAATLKKSVQTDSGDLLAWRALAAAYEKNGDVESSIATWKEIKRIFPRLSKRADQRLMQLTKEAEEKRGEN